MKWNIQYLIFINYLVKGYFKSAYSTIEELDNYINKNIVNSNFEEITPIPNYSIENLYGKPILFYSISSNENELTDFLINKGATLTKEDMIEAGVEDKYLDRYLERFKEVKKV